MTLFDLSGRLALVTGSTRGLGATIARGLAQAGARVVLNGRDEGTLESAAAALRKDGFAVDTACFDVTDDAAAEAAVARIEAEVGPLDILVNNAGVQRRVPLAEFGAAPFRQMLDIHVTAAYVIGSAVARAMIPRGRGKIINICSVLSEVARPTIVPYAAAKGALKQLTRGMAAEWAPLGLNVNGIGPGYFDTDLVAAIKADPVFNSWLMARTPAGRWGDPVELIGPAVFLASDASSFVNGHVLYVDGGILAAL